MTGLRVALSLLTTIPVGADPRHGRALARAVPWFPVVGALLGVALAGAYASLRLVLPGPVAALAALSLGVVLTGAFHEDGLADTADAMGGRDRQEALRILKDPTHGTNGVLAIVLSVTLRAAALATMNVATAVAVLPAAHALSRGAAGVLLRVVGPATTEGLGASYAAAVTPARVTLGAGAALVVALVSIGPWALPAAVLAGAGACSVGALARHRFGGLTGDVLGAAQQIGEIAVLALGAAVAPDGWAAQTWWR
jgi:adenosylcobinamide-GDP ribazoletransferase